MKRHSHILFVFLLCFYNSLFSQIPDSTIQKSSADSLLNAEVGSDLIIGQSVSDSTEKKGKKFKSHIVPDTVFLRNGDKFTGVILSYTQGRLSFDANGPGVISLKWNKISSISGGSKVYKVEDVRGVIYIGQIALSPDTGEILILGQVKYGVLLENLVRIYPLESDWFRGFKGTLGGGASYTKSSEILQLNAEYNLYYVISKWRFISDFSYIHSSTEDDAPSVRVQLNLQELYALPKRWVLSEINSFNRNDELGISARFSFGVGGGNNIIQTERQRLLVQTGILQNLEKDIESVNVISNLEWPATLSHTIYSFDKPNLSSSTSITSFVGITEKGRYRLDASTDITWEFINNIKLKITAYYNYDNKILEGKDTEEDYGTILSLLIELK